MSDLTCPDFNFQKVGKYATETPQQTNAQFLFCKDDQMKTEEEGVRTMKGTDLKRGKRYSLYLLMSSHQILSTSLRLQWGKYFGHFCCRNQKFPHGENLDKLALSLFYGLISKTTKKVGSSLRESQAMDGWPLLPFSTTYHLQTALEPPKCA